MNVVEVIVAAILCTILFFLTFSITDKKEEYGAKQINVIGIMLLIITFLVGMRQQEVTTIEVRILTNIILYGLSVLTVTDIKKQYVPNKFLVYLLVAWATCVWICIIFNTEYGVVLLAKSLIGAIVGGGVFLLCYILSHKQIGAGDVKLVFVMGLFLTGDRIIGAIFYGVLLCSLYSLIQMARKRLNMKDGVPLVPFLTLGTVVTLFIL